jgi:hypothetical protein
MYTCIYRASIVLGALAPLFSTSLYTLVHPDDVRILRCAHTDGGCAGGSGNTATAALQTNQATSGFCRLVTREPYTWVQIQLFVVQPTRANTPAHIVGVVQTIGCAH